MAYGNVQNSGVITTTGTISWTPASGPTVGNLLTARLWHNSSAVTFGASDTKDSSGTPKTYNMDVQRKDATTHGDAAIYSLIVPSGLTTPVKNTTATAQTMQGIFDEWSGNASSSVLDQTNSGVPASGTSATGATINTGANAGIILTSMVNDGNGQANAGITTTGTNFVQDAVSNNDQTTDSGVADHRTTSAASQTGVGDSWSWTGAAVATNVIASYNAPASGGGTFVPELTRMLLGVGF